MYRVLSLIALTVCVVVLAGPQTANADLLTKDSADFSYKYEMAVDPTTQDLAGTPTGVDFGNVGGLGTLGTMSGNTVLTMTCDGSHYYSSLGGSLAGALSNASDLTYANGYTIEIRGKTNQGAQAYCFGLEASEDGTVTQGLQVYLSDGAMEYQSTAGSVTDSPESNHSDFHVFRFAQLPNTNQWRVWRDGTELFTSSTLAGKWNDGPFWLLGGGSGSNSGTFDMDYLRVTSEAYAPVPEPGTLALLATGLIGLLCYAWRKRK